MVIAFHRLRNLALAAALLASVAQASVAQAHVAPSTCSVTSSVDGVIDLYIGHVSTGDKMVLYVDGDYSRTYYGRVWNASCSGTSAFVTDKAGNVQCSYGD